MAQTEKGIVYPYNYDEAADVPADLKALAESIDALLNNYSLNTDSGNKIVLEMNNTTYKIKAVLKDKNDNVISTSNEIDLPLENMVTNISYNNQTLTLTHQDGQTTEVSIADLISDLASKEEVTELQSQVDDLTTLVETELESNEVEGTEIDVSDSAEYRGRMEVKGNTEQEQLSGKNLWGRFSFTRTMSGVTHQQNADGSIIVNGSTTNAKSYSMMSQDAVTNERIITLPAGDYTLSGASANVKLQFVKRDGTALFSTNSSYSFTLTEETQGFVRTYVMENTVVNNETLYIQLEQGSTATDWEPYCGGQASPNPEYPQEIKVVTGDNVIKHVGKNLFDKDNANILNAYIDETTSVITANSANRTLYIKCKPNTTYTISKARTVRFRVAYTKDIPAVGTAIYGYNAQSQVINNLAYMTFATGKDAEYLICTFSQTVQDSLTIDEILDTVQIEEGTTTTPYEPYREDDYNLNLGNIELCKIGDYQDIPFKNVVGDENYNSSLTEGAWYKKEIINKRTLNSSEIAIANNDSYDQITYVSFAKDTNDYVYNKYNSKKVFGNVMISDNSSFPPGWNNSAKLGFVFSNADPMYYWYGVEKGTSLEQIQSKLNGALLYTVRATAKYTQITNPTLISQLEALRKAKWFKGVNHWWTETENLEPVLKGTYKQSNNLRLQALEQAVVALGGV